MMHTNRTWQISDEDALAPLVDKLIDTTWCCCQGFRYGNLYLLNDATGAEGAQEYAVVDAHSLVQFESLTISWMDRDTLEQTLIDYVLGQGRDQRLGKVEPRQFDHPQHGRCRLCA